MSNIYDPIVIKHEVAKEKAYFALTGGIINDHFWNALTARRDLNPARFDHYHPNVAEFFKQPPVIEHPVTPPITVPPPVICPPVMPPPSTSCPPPPGGGGGGGTGVVPEPASAILLSIPLVFAGLVLWMRKRHDHS